MPGGPGGSKEPCRPVPVYQKTRAGGSHQGRHCAKTVHAALHDKQYPGIQYELRRDEF